MGAALQKKLLALDSNVLYDLANARDFAHTFREVFQEKGYGLVVSPTVVQELAYHAKWDRMSEDEPETFVELVAREIAVNLTVVVDTNILFSATDWRGNRFQCVERARAGEIRAVSCPELMEEFAEKLESFRAMVIEGRLERT